MSRSTRTQRKPPAPAPPTPARVSPSPTETSGPAGQRTPPSGGQALEAGVRDPMALSFGYDFSQVRVHTDDRAAGSARSLGARAYTEGSDIVFGAGEYAPGNAAGQQLIAHELAHVVQQTQLSSAPDRAAHPLTLSQPTDPFERAADAAALQATAAGPMRPALAGVAALAVPPSVPQIFRKASAPQLSPEEALAQVQQEVGDSEAEGEAAGVDLPASEPALQEPGAAAQGAAEGGEGGGAAAPAAEAPAKEASKEAPAVAAPAPTAPQAPPPLDAAAPAATPAAPKPEAIAAVPKPPPLEIKPVSKAAAAAPSVAPAAAPVPAASPPAAEQHAAPGELAAAPSPEQAASVGATAETQASPAAKADAGLQAGADAATMQPPSADGSALAATLPAPTDGAVSPADGQAPTPERGAAAARAAEPAPPAGQPDAGGAPPAPGAAPSAPTASVAGPAAEQAAAPAAPARATTPAPAEEGRAPVASGGGGAAPAGDAGARAPASPGEDPAFQAVAARSQGVAAQQQAHEPAGGAATRAQAAADPAGSDVTMTAQGRQVAEIGAQPPGEFNAAAFKTMLFQKIAEAAPKTLKDAEEFKSNNRLGDVKNEVAGQVRDQKEQSAGPVQDKTDASPETGGIQAKPVQPLQPAEPGAAPPPLGAEAAAPKPRSDAEVSAPIAAESRSLDDQMAAANVTDEQLERSNEPSFTKSLEAKHGAQQDAAAAPARFRQQEQGALAGAQAQATATADQKAAAMRQERVTMLGQVFGMQGEAKGADEVARRGVADHIAEIYQKTRDDVNGILGGLDDWVTKEFDAGTEAATRTCVDHVNDKILWYKLERYLSIPVVGQTRWLHDLAFGLPPEANRFYEEGRKLYLDSMDVAISRIAEHIAAELNRAKARVAEGLKAIQTYVAGLSPDLQQVGKEATSQIQGKFEELTQSISDKQGELVDKLAQSYQDKLQEVDGKLNEIRQANSGLIAQAKQLIADTIGKILELKAALETMLSQAASAIGLILRDPIGFLGNLLEGVKQGFMNFVGNIGTHLQTGLIQWLTGAVTTTGIRMPAQFDVAGIFDLVLQILGLTVDNIKLQVRKQLVRSLGPRAEQIIGALEKAWEIFQIIQSEGLAGLWRFIQDKVGDLYEMVMGQIKQMIAVQVIEAGIRWLVGLLGGPAGAFIKAVEAIIKVVGWFVENAQRLAGLVSAIFNSVSAIASGNLGQAATYIEGVLARSIPLLIGFLADLLGLGGITDKVRGIIAKVQAPIQRGIAWLVGKAVALGKRMFAALGRMFGRGKRNQPEAAGSEAAAGPEAEKQRRWDAGVAAVRALPPESEEDIGPALAGIKGEYGFNELRPIEAGEKWRVHAVMREEADISVPQEDTVKISSFGPRPKFSDEIRRSITLDAGMHRRHIIAYDTLAERLKQSLNGRTLTSAAKILSKSAGALGMPGFDLEPPLNQEKIRVAGYELLKQQNSDAENLWAGGGSENSSLGSSMGAARRKIEAAIESGDEQKLEEGIQTYQSTAYDPNPDGPTIGVGRQNTLKMVVKGYRKRFRDKYQTQRPRFGSSA